MQIKTGDKLIESLIQRISDLEVAVARLIGNPVVNQQADPTEGYAKWREEQVRGMMGQAAVAPEKPEAKWNDTEGLRSICSYINDTPALRSLLYDLDLLPEQVKPDSREGSHMLSIAEAWKAEMASIALAVLDKAEAEVKPASIWHDAKTDPPKVDGSYIAHRRDPSAADDRCAAWFDTDSGEWESECGEIIIPSPNHWTDLPTPP